jgi:hypothetical protein
MPEFSLLFDQMALFFWNGVVVVHLYSETTGTIRVTSGNAALCGTSTPILTMKTSRTYIKHPEIPDGRRSSMFPFGTASYVGVNIAISISVLQCTNYSSDAQRLNSSNFTYP